MSSIFHKIHGNVSLSIQLISILFMELAHHCADLLQPSFNGWHLIYGQCHTSNMEFLGGLCNVHTTSSQALKVRKFENMNNHVPSYSFTV